MSLLLPIRARLSSLDDDDDDADAATASPLSSGASSPPGSPSPSPPPAPRVILGAAPRVAAQLSSSSTDDEEVFDDAADFGEEDEVLEEVSNGFFRIARVPAAPSTSSGEGDPISSGDEEPAARSASASEGSEYFGPTEGSLEDGFAGARSDVDVFDAGAGGEPGKDAGVVVGDKGVGVEGSLDGSFLSSRSLLDDVETAAALGDFVNLSDGSVMIGDDQEGQDVGDMVVSDVVPTPVVGDAGVIDGGGMGIMVASEGKAGAGFEHQVTELPPVVDSTEEIVDFELLDGGSDAEDTTRKHEVVTDVEDASPEHVATRNAPIELVDVNASVDDRHSIADGGHMKLDGESRGDHESSDGPVSVPITGTNSAVELLGIELEDNVPASKGTRFGLDDLDDDEVNDDGDEEEEVTRKERELSDYAAIAELLRAANRSPGPGNAKVFPIETADSRQLPPTVVGIPRTNVAPTMTDPECEMTDEEKKLYQKVDMARIKYLRLVHRLGYDTEHLAPIQVLHRLSLVEGFRRIRMANHSAELENAWKRAVQLEAEGTDGLEFTCNLLVLGKTGVGKSATINSIFGEDKSKTNAFLPATSSVKEIAGVVGGVKFRVIDTPGLGATVMDEKSNRKVLNSVKKYIKRCPPDIVLYVDRIDTQRQGTDNLSLLRCVTSVLGLSIWSKAVITLTHSGAYPPEGPNGSPMNYEMFVTHRAHALQQNIQQATKDPHMKNVVALVENHPLCRRNMEGEKVLPDGMIWRRELLLLFYSLKMGAEIDSLSSRRAASASRFGLRLQMPPLPYFLSSLLQSREHPRRANEQNIESVYSDVDLDEFLNGDQDDEDYGYNQLPSFKPLSKSQVAKLSKEQQKLYFDEYDYRIKLLQKMQLTEQLRRLKEVKKNGGNSHAVPVDNDHPNDEYEADRSPMPDWALPSSFDSDDPVYRYRCLEPTPNLLVRAVTNPDGWDHDCGYDGLSLQHSLDVVNTFPASLWVQINKDKREFSIHLESSVSAKHSGYASTLAGFDIQTMMDQLAYTLRGETKFKNFKKNTTTGGLSMTFLGDAMVTGAKFEDKLSVGNRLTLSANTGAATMKGDTAYAVNMEATLREKDYPMGQGLTTLGASLVRWHKEWTVAANLDSQFSVGRASSMGVHVDVNNKLTGRVSIKANTSEQLKIALLGVCSTAMYFWSRMHPCSDPYYE